MPIPGGSGALDKRVQIQAASDVLNAHGGQTRTWNTVATVWARIEPLSGNELLEAQQVEERADVKITIRNYPGLTSKHRILWAQGA